MQYTIQQGIWALCIGACFMFFIFSVTQCERKRTELRQAERVTVAQSKAEAIKSGADPILVKCAFDGDLSSPTCVSRIFGGKE